MNVHVGITGIHIASAPKVGAAVAKVLTNDPAISLIGLVDYPQSCALAWDATFESVHLVPQAAWDPAGLVVQIIEIHHHRAFDVLLPCSDDDVLAFSKRRDQLLSAGIRCLLPSSTTVESMRKEHLSETLGAMGLTVPRAAVYSSASDIRDDGNLTFPVVVKGRLCDAYAANDLDDTCALAERIEDTWGGPIIVQEYVAGAELSIAVVADEEGRVRGLCALRKIAISEQGKTWAGCTINFPELEQLANRVVQGAGWVGPLELECIWKNPPGELTVIEINPRLPAWVAVGAAAEANLPRLIVDILMGQASDGLVRARSGVSFVRTCFTSTFPIARMGQLVSSGSVLC